MARKPDNFEWLGFRPGEVEQLDFFDYIGNNGWARNSQTDEVMPKLLKEWTDSGKTLPDLLQAMAAIGYDEDALHELERWESRRTTGRFGR